MTINSRDGAARSLSISAVIAVLAISLGPSAALGQTPVDNFLLEQGQEALRSSNLGRSALAIQFTCFELIDLNTNTGGVTGSTLELFQRCSELVTTANSLTAAPNPAATGLELGYTNPTEMLAAFQQVNGEELQASASMAQTASNEQFSSIAARLGALRGATSTSVASLTAAGTEFMFGSGGGASADDAGMPFGPWGWFVRGTFTTGERDPSDPNSFVGQEDGFEFDQYGVTVGIDRSSGASVWGVALGYSSYDLDMTSRSAGSGVPTNIVSGGSIEADNISGTVFYDYSAQNNLYFSAVAGFGSQTFDMARKFVYFAPDPTNPVVTTNQTRGLTAAPDGNSLAGAVTLGRPVNRGSWFIDPHVGLSVDRITIDQFSEVDSGNSNPNSTGAIPAMQLAFAEQDIDSLRANIGVQFSNNINTGFGSIRPTFSAEWYHEFEDDPRSIKVKYALEDVLASDTSLPTNNFRTGFDDCISCFSLTSEAPDSDYFVVGAGIAAAFQGGLQAFAMFESLLGYENLNAYSLTLGLRGTF